MFRCARAYEDNAKEQTWSFGKVSGRHPEEQGSHMTMPGKANTNLTPRGLRQLVHVARLSDRRYPLESGNITWLYTMLGVERVR